jgi:hypothetical protein
MATTQFLIRNRHCNVWYGRIIVPLKLRKHFNGKRERRKSLRTSDQTEAKRLALQFWIECQYGFDRLHDTLEASFANTAQFVTWMGKDSTGKETLLHMPPLKKDDKGFIIVSTSHRIDFTDPFGKKHVVDLGDPEKEAELALKPQEKAEELPERYKDNPAMLDRLFNAQASEPLSAPKVM